MIISSKSTNSRIAMTTENGAFQRGDIGSAEFSERFLINRDNSQLDL